MAASLPGMSRNRSRRFISGELSDSAPEGAPLGGSRSEAMQRLQIGLFGIGSMVLLVGLASVIGSQADLTEEAAVPEAAPTTEPTETAAQRDPLADAGIVPDIPAEPSPSPSPAPTTEPLELPPAETPRNTPPADRPANESTSQD